MITSHRERIERCLSGDELDRIPVAFWRHFPVDDQTPDGLAAATALFQQTYDFDLIKVTPASSYCTRDWGTIDTWKGNPEGTRDYANRPVQTATDWTKLPHLNPYRGHLNDQILCLKLLISHFSPHTPVLQTIFSPLSIAKNLAGKDRLLEHIRSEPDAVHIGLEIITQTLLRHVDAVLKTGLDGIFFAVQHAQYDLLTSDEFAEFEKPYDQQVFALVSDLWMNILHIHGENIMFDQVMDYPAQIINWHDQHTPPSLSEGIRKSKRTVCGGLRQWETMVYGTPAEVSIEAENAIRDTGGNNFILGTGCVLPIIAPHGNIKSAIRSAFEHRQSQAG